MRIVSDFYVRKVSSFGEAGKRTDGVEVVLHACGDERIASPSDEMLDPLAAPGEFGASGVLVLRVTNERPMKKLQPGAVFSLVLSDEKKAPAGE